MRIHLLGLVLIAAIGAVASEPTKKPKPGKIEEACSVMINESTIRDDELAKKNIEIVEKMQAIVTAIDPRLGKMSQAQQDEYNLLLAQMRHIQALGFAEMTKRRAYKEILDLALVERTQDEIFYDFINSGNFNDMAKVNAGSEKLLEDRLGQWATIYIVKVREIKMARQTHVALTIPFTGLIDRMRMASLIPSFLSDDLELFYSDGDLTQSKPFLVFVSRLREEKTKGNKEAEEIWRFLNEEWLKPKK